MVTVNICKISRKWDVSIKCSGIARIFNEEGGGGGAKKWGSKATEQGEDVSPLPR